MRPRPEGHEPRRAKRSQAVGLAGVRCLAPDRYFARLHDAYAAAARHGGEQTFGLSIGPAAMQVSFASSELAGALLPPLTRLLAPATGGAGIKIRVWDSASTGVPVPPFPWRPADVGVGGTVSGFDNERFRTLYRDDGSGFHSVSMFDSRARVGYFWFRDHERINWYERAEPLRAAIHWGLTTDRRFLAHASAVGDERGALLLTGRGGAGKTTTTLAAIDGGLRFVGDNYVFVSLEADPVVYGLYANAKLWPETLERLLPQLEPHVQTHTVAPDEKLVVDVAGYRPERLSAHLPIRAVVIPSVTGAGEARVTPCTPVQTLLALAPSTLLQLPRTDRGLDGMSALVRRVPSFKLELGQDVTSGPRALSKLLGELTGDRG